MTPAPMVLGRGWTRWADPEFVVLVGFLASGLVSFVNDVGRRVWRVWREALR